MKGTRITKYGLKGRSQNGLYMTEFDLNLQGHLGVKKVLTDKKGFVRSILELELEHSLFDK